MKNEHLKKVTEFSILYGFEPLSKEATKGEIRAFIYQRYKLFISEKKELLEALKVYDPVEIADGFADMLYIALGSYYLSQNIEWLKKIYLKRVVALYEAIYKVYTHTQFELIFNEVHRSNMSKACNSLDTAMKTIASDRYKHLSSFKINVNGGQYALYSNSEDLFNDVPKGKLLKSIDYSEADLNFVKEWK